MNPSISHRRLVALLVLASSTFPALWSSGAEPLPAAVANSVSLTPATVPPTVVLARPSPAEVATATNALNQFMVRADPATQGLLKKYPELLAVRPPRANPALVPGLANNLRAKHATNVALAQKGDIDLLFMGDSITDSWRSTGKEVFARYYGDLKVANFGIGSDTIQGVLYRLRDGEGQGFQPKAIVLLIGTNNAGALSSGEIAEGAGAVVGEMRERFPAAKILLLAIFPRANPGDAIRNTVLGANPLLAKLHDGQHVFYLDLGAKFLAPDGTLSADIMPDKLHPTAKGYEIWADAMKDQLVALLN